LRALHYNVTFCEFVVMWWRETRRGEMRQGQQVRGCLRRVWARAWPVAAILLVAAAPLLMAGAALRAGPGTSGRATDHRHRHAAADLSPWGMFLNADMVVQAS